MRKRAVSAPEWLIRKVMAGIEVPDYEPRTRAQRIAMYQGVINDAQRRMRALQDVVDALTPILATERNEEAKQQALESATSDPARPTDSEVGKALGSADQERS